MGHIIADRIQETTATTGTGSLTLGGALTGYKTFNSEMANADTCYYIIDDGIGSWETGLGTYTDTDVLARTSVLKSSNSDSLVNLAAGTKVVSLVQPAASIVGQLAGTFTPAVAGTTSAGAGTYSVQSGSYLKIGKLVFFRIALVWSAHTGTGNYSVTGLPFTSENSTYNTPCTVFFSGITYSGQVEAWVFANLTTINIYSVATNALYQNLAMDTDYTVTPQSLFLSGTYIAAS